MSKDFRYFTICSFLSIIILRNAIVDKMPILALAFGISAGISICLMIISSFEKPEQ